MARIDLSNYDIEFTRNLGYGFKRYTWFVTRRNYSRDGFLSSETVWCYTTDSSLDYDAWKDESMTEYKWIQYIKSRPTTKRYVEPYSY